jgi:hypothetical protein
MSSAGRGNQNRSGPFWISNLLTENEGTGATTLLGIFMLFLTVNLFRLYFNFMNETKI